MPEIGNYATPDGVRIGYATYGNDEAPPLLHFYPWPERTPVASASALNTS